MTSDRRIRKTEQALQYAFIHLVLEKDFSQITVKELCERADINKSTFYLHYRDLYDLASRIKQQLLDDVYHIIEEYDVLCFASRSSEIWTRILHLFQENDCLYLAYLTSSSLFFLNPTLEETLISRMMEKARKDHPELSGEKQRQLHISITFIINGFLGLMMSLDFDGLPDAVFFISETLKA